MFNPAVGWVSSEYSLTRRHPVTGVTQPHRGIDIAATTGTPVYAAFAGVVDYVVDWAWNGDKRFHFPLRTGNGVLIRNPDGELQWYGHLHTVRVKQGQHVTKGQQLGTVGATGNVTGPHLHFETHNPSSTWANNFTRTYDPRIAFRNHKITPGKQTILPATRTSSSSRKGFTVSDVKKILDAINKQGTANQVNAVYRRQREYRDHTDKQLAALAKRLDAVEARVNTRASAAQVKSVYGRQRTYQNTLLAGLQKIGDAIKDKLNISITLKDK